MRATVHSDALTFAAKARPFLLARPVEHTTLLTVLEDVLRGIYPKPWLCLVEEAGAPCGVAMWTTSRGVVLSRMSDACAAAIAAQLPTVPAPSHVIGFPSEASVFACAFSARVGGSSAPDNSLGLYRCDALVWPAEVPGRWTAFEQRELPTLIRFAEAFGAELHLPMPVPQRLEQAVQERRVFGWEHEGERVSIAMRSVPCGGVVRVQLVYTPPRWRGHGFAARCVAELTRAIQSDGFLPVLFADRANPTSTGVYLRLGYVDVGDWVELKLPSRSP